MSSDEEEASHMIVVEGIHRLGESLFLEVDMSTTGRLPLMRGVLRRPAVRPILQWSITVSPGQEGIVLRIKRQTQDLWSQQKQAHIDYQAHLKHTKSVRPKIRAFVPRRKNLATQ